jgi:hypothetical protein
LANPLALTYPGLTHPRSGRLVYVLKNLVEAPITHVPWLSAKCSSNRKLKIYGDDEGNFKGEEKNSPKNKKSKEKKYYIFQLYFENKYSKLSLSCITTNCSGTELGDCIVKAEYGLQSPL